MIGTTIDRYKIMEELGHGGMSVVYRGIDRSLEREVAVKVLHEHLAKRADNRERFAREAKAIAKLHHPNILEIYDFSSAASDRAYIVMEYIAGRNLRQFIETYGPPPAEIVALMMRSLGGALGHAHDKGIIHRDIKPENIMISHDGDLKLMDFGIAHVFDQETMTQTGSLLGSPGHMAPEMIEGSRADERGDVFSLGTVLYWMAVGELPFVGKNTPQVLKRVLEGEYEDPEEVRPEIGAELSRIIRRCLEHDADERYDTVGEMVEDIEDFLALYLPQHQGETLEAYFASPGDFAKDFEASLVPRLVKMGRSALARRDHGAAFAALNRALAYDPHNAEVAATLRSVLHQRRRVGATVMVACALPLLAIGGWWWGNHRVERQTRASVQASLLGVSVALDSAQQGTLLPGALALARESIHRSSALSDEAQQQQAMVDGLNASEKIIFLAHVRVESAREEALLQTNAPPSTVAVSVKPRRFTGPNTTSTTNNASVTTVAATTAASATTTAAVDKPEKVVHTYKFRLIPLSAQLEVGQRKYGAIEAAQGIPLSKGNNFLTLSGPSIKRKRISVLVEGAQDNAETLVGDWKAGNIEVRVDRDAVLQFKNVKRSDRRLKYGEKRRFEFGFGRADRDAPRKEIVFVVRDAKDLTRSTEHRVELKPGGFERITVTLN